MAAATCTNEVMGYKLFLTLQEGSYQSRPFSWEPVMTTVVVGWLSSSHWNPELPIFNQLDEQESKQQREFQIMTLIDRPYGGHSSSTLPCEWVQGQPPFNVFLISTGHSYSSIASYPFRYGDEPDRPHSPMAYPGRELPSAAMLPPTTLCPPPNYPCKPAW